MAITTRTLGRTGADVTILGYGAMELRGQPRGPEIADEDAGRLLNAVLDGGINLIDTSPDYGRSEELIGALHRPPPGRVLPRLQVRLPDRDARRRAAALPARLQPRRTSAPTSSRACAGCAPTASTWSRCTCRRAGPCSRRTAPSRSCRRCSDEGKVRFIGMSGILPNLPDHIAMNVFDVFQIPYSAVQRDHEELITEAAASGRGHVHPRRRGPRRGLGGEELAGRAAHPAARRRPAELGDVRHRGAAGRGGIPAMEFILRFTLSHPGPVHHDRRHREPRSPAAATSRSPRRARSRPTSTPRPASASRSPNDVG